MGIKTTVVNEVVCDACSNQIANDDVWVDYGERGIVFHWSCVAEMDALTFIGFALERGDQMFVKIDTQEMKGVELKHIWKDYSFDPNVMQQVVIAYKEKWSNNESVMYWSNDYK